MRTTRTRVPWVLLACIGMVLATRTLPIPTAHTAPASTAYALQFFGNGAGDIDRVKIALGNPSRPVDVGGDFTIEFWMKARAADNTSGPCAAGGSNWINGNTIIDRDVYGGGDFGDYGISLYGGRIAFGVARGANENTICSASGVADGQWHHIAVTRNTATGQLRIFVDGQVDAQGSGPAGDVSYRDGRPTVYPNDPFLVIGAEKHDAGPQYPSYRGLLDDVRISNTVRYSGNFAPPTAPHAADGATVALYRFDEGNGATIIDSAPGGQSPGVVRYGGSPAGPVWVFDTPFGPPPQLDPRAFIPLVVR